MREHQWWESQGLNESRCHIPNMSATILCAGDLHRIKGRKDETREHFFLTFHDVSFLVVMEWTLQNCELNQFFLLCSLCQVIWSWWWEASYYLFFQMFSIFCNCSTIYISTCIAIYIYIHTKLLAHELHCCICLKWVNAHFLVCIYLYLGSTCLNMKSVIALVLCLFLW